MGGDSEIGGFTARYLAASSDDVLVTSRRRTGTSLFLDLASDLRDWWPPVGVTSACICAAKSRLAQCEADPVGTAKINVTQVGTLVERLLDGGVFVLFLSSNQVFDGTRPLVPVDAPRSPVSEYGRQKAQMEVVLERALAGGAPVAVLRLTKVIPPGMQLLTEWARGLRARSSIHAFSDMCLAPIPLRLVGEAIRCIMRDRSEGFFQLSGPDDLSYHELAQRLAQQLGVSTSLVRGTSVLGTAPPVGACPRYTSLDSSELRLRYGIEVPDPSSVVREIVDSTH